MIRSLRILNVTILLIASCMLLAACGGGGETAGPGQAPSGPVTVLAWDPPANFADSTPLNPYQDIDHYEVYAREDPNFSELDTPLLRITAVTSDTPVDSTRKPAGVAVKGGAKPQSEFILENLDPYVSGAKRQYVTLRAVGVEGQKSAFMPPVVWDRS